MYISDVAVENSLGLSAPAQKGENSKAVIMIWITLEYSKAFKCNTTYHFLTFFL